MYINDVTGNYHMTIIIKISKPVNAEPNNGRTDHSHVLYFISITSYLLTSFSNKISSTSKFKTVNYWNRQNKENDNGDV